LKLFFGLAGHINWQGAIMLHFFESAFPPFEPCIICQVNTPHTALADDFTNFVATPENFTGSQWNRHPVYFNLISALDDNNNYNEKLVINDVSLLYYILNGLYQRHIVNRIKDDFPVLVAQSGLLSGQRWMLNRAVIIGRDATCEVIIADRQISRFHARIMPAPSGIILEDLGSKNGTFCNGQKVDNTLVLQDGDVIQVALVQHFTYMSSDSTLPLTETTVLEDSTVLRLHLDKRSHRVWVHQQELIPPLSVSQFKLLQALYEKRDQVVPRDQLVDTIWGSDQSEGVSEEALDALVRRLRDRLKEIDATHAYILTVRGFGLRLDNPVSRNNHIT
jgi:pSer/pThr/pTyr-binding forkhead associated (FHA) protein